MDNVPEVFAPTTNAVHFFRGVNHLKIGRKAANDLQCLPGFEPFDELRKIFTRLLVLFPATDRSQAGLFHELEEFVSALFTNNFAKHRAKRTDVVAQRLVFIFESYILTPKRLVDPGGHFQSRKFSYFRGKPMSPSLSIAITLCRSSRFLPLTRNLSP